MLRERLDSWLSSEKLDRAIAALELKVPGHDPWGFSPREGKKLARLYLGIYRYFRPQVEGIENLPRGRVLLIANHSGQFPYDGIVIGMTCMLDANPPRVCRTMVERWVPSLPYISTMFSRAGAVLGDPINCRNLLEKENAILVFPEGVKGSGKTWDKRYQLQKFGRGFMRLALQTGTPIVPISVVGAEESIPSVYNAKGLAKMMGAPYLPIPPHLPLLGPLAYLPLPTKFYIDFGMPITIEGRFDDEDAVIDKYVEEVRGTIQTMINNRRAARTSIF